MATAFEIPIACVKVALDIVELIPRAPEKLYPHAKTFPSDLSATEKFPPPATATALEIPIALTKVSREIPVLSPIRPPPLAPHPSTLPSARIAMVCKGPHEIATNSWRP